MLLQTLDHLWREHLVTLEHLRQVIGFRSYGQRDPLNEYKSEGFLLFEAMLARLREAVTGQLMHIQFSADEPPPEPEPSELPPMQAHHINPLTGEDEFELAEAALAAERGGESSAREPKPEPVRVRKAAAARSERSGDLGQGRPQRQVPLRLRQEIQALPRAALGRDRHGSRAGMEACASMR